MPMFYVSPCPLRSKQQIRIRHVRILWADEIRRKRRKGWKQVARAGALSTCTGKLALDEGQREGGWVGSIPDPINQPRRITKNSGVHDTQLVVREVLGLPKTDLL